MFLAVPAGTGGALHHPSRETITPSPTHAAAMHERRTCHYYGAHLAMFGDLLFIPNERRLA